MNKRMLDSFAGSSRSLRGEMGASCRQRGVAAIEFSLVFLLLFVIFYGLVTFVDVFLKIQSVSRAAENGARLAQRYTVGSTTVLDEAQKLAVENVVYESIAQSAFAVGSDLAARTTWVRTNAQVNRVALNQQIVEVKFLYGNNRVLPYIPLFDMSSWLLNDSDFSINVKSAWSL